jgi:hypothetical protein
MTLDKYNKFIPDSNKSIPEQNKNNFQEKYNTILCLRDSYSNILNELTDLKNHLIDFIGEQSNLSLKNLNNSDRIRYNALLKDRYLALKMIHDTTVLEKDFGKDVYPFKESLDASSAINIDFNWISKGNKLQSNYACRLAIFKVCDALNSCTNEKYSRMTINTLDSYNESEITEGRVYYLNNNLRLEESKLILKNNLLDTERIIDRIIINLQSAHYGLNKLIRIAHQQGVCLETN